MTNNFNYFTIVLNQCIFFDHQNFLVMVQKTILKDKAVVEVFRAMLGAVTPVQGIVGRHLLD